MQKFKAWERYFLSFLFENKVNSINERSSVFPHLNIAEKRQRCLPASLPEGRYFKVAPLSFSEEIAHAFRHLYSLHRRHVYTLSRKEDNNFLTLWFISSAFL